jgi:hypothetical protein
MAEYKLYIRPPRTEPDAAMRFNADGSVASFIFGPANKDYQTYLEWLAEGNKPLPADEPAGE